MAPARPWTAALALSVLALAAACGHGGAAPSVAPEPAAAPPLATPAEPAPAPAPEPAPAPPVSEDLPLRPPPAHPGLDLALDGAALLGLGVPATGLLAGAAGLGLHLRGARRWVVAATFRAARRELDQFGLTRLRIGLSAGAWLRRSTARARASNSRSSNGLAT